MHLKYGIMDSKENKNKAISLLVTGNRASEIVDFTVKTLLCAGYTGSDQEKVRKHIEELKKIGVSAPEKVPTEYRVPPNLLTNKEEIVVKGEKTSGEAEYVILLKNERIYVTIGSDHTDRLLEKVSIEMAKQACPKVVAKEAWIFDEIEDHWDEIIIKAQVTKKGKRILYQEDKLQALLDPNELIEIFKVENHHSLFSGTIPLKTELIYADEFEMELFDPIFKRSIRHKYRVKAI